MNLKNKSIKAGVYAMLIAVSAFIIIHFYFKPLDVHSVTLGALVGLCNFYVILWAWSRIFIKKRIALALGVIVIKYAILLLILYLLIVTYKNYVGSFLVGVTTMVIITFTFLATLVKEVK